MQDTPMVWIMEPEGGSTFLICPGAWVKDVKQQGFGTFRPHFGCTLDDEAFQGAVSIILSFYDNGMNVCMVVADELHRG